MQARIVRRNNEGFRTWSFGHGYSDYAQGQYSIAQDIVSALYEFKYDAFWALQNGIDWRTRLGYHNQKELLDNDVLEIIQNRYGVLNVSNFYSTVTDRDYSCQCNVYTIFAEEPYPISFAQTL